MKKWLIALLTLLALSLSVAFAAEANDITEDCKFKVCSSGRKYTLMTDKKYTSYWESNKIKTPWIAITAPEGKPIAGLYVCFGNMPESWEIQTSDDGKDWFTAVPGDTRFLHAYVALPQPAQHVRLAVTSEKKTALRINDLFVLSEGDLPDWVQVWQPTEEKADILFLSTHPDDELIFFGGAIPTYAVEQQRKVVVAYFTRSNTTRSSELLNGLWHMGVRTYPVIGNFKDSYAKNLKAAYKTAGGKGKVNEWIVGLYRQYKPEVVVTQDTNGEYGHKQHMMIADAAQNCIALAANEDEFTASTIAYGTWQVKKLYLHLYPENQITFDWTVPLKSMNGATGIELAEEAYTLHKTQASSGMSVTETGTKYDNRVFGLAFTTVGEDVRKDDFLENIYDAPGSYDAAANNVEATPAPTEVPAYMAHMPALNAKGFLDEGEYLYSSEDEGLWIYVSQTSKVIIQRKYDATQPLTWFEADLYGDLDAGEMLRTVQNDPEKMGKVRVDATETAKKHNVVFAMNTDYYTYRVAVNNNRHTGIVIRDGRILYDDPYTEKQVTNSMFPNLDMLAFMPDGSLKVYHSWEKDGAGVHRRGCTDGVLLRPVSAAGRQSVRARLRQQREQESALRHRHGRTRSLCRHHVRRAPEALRRRYHQLFGEDDARQGLSGRFQYGRRADGSDGLHGQAAQPDWRLRRRQDQLPPDKRSAGLRHIRAGRDVRSAINILFQGRRTRFCPVFSEKNREITALTLDVTSTKML